MEPRVGQVTRCGRGVELVKMEAHSPGQGQAVTLQASSSEAL
jgi:hypothetical protein